MGVVSFANVLRIRPIEPAANLASNAISRVGNSAWYAPLAYKSALVPVFIKLPVATNARLRAEIAASRIRAFPASTD